MIVRTLESADVDWATSDTELEQLAMDLGGSPQWVLEAHSSDQERHFSGNPRPAPRRTGPLSPVGGKALSMPPHDSFGLDHRYASDDAAPTAEEH
jgi:hypothetical protein